ncbi:MAG: LamG-like jellyroll fold domain-containing protein, partial [Bacteroidota bacterium]
MAKLYIHNLCVLAVWLCFTFAVSHAQGNALHFTSGPDRVHIPNPIAGHTEYTFEAWFRSDNTSTASNHIARIANLGTTYKRFEIGDTDGDLMIYDGGYRRILGSNIRDGQYHHVAISKKNDTYRVYLDGVLVRTQTDAHHLRSTLVIGSFNSSNASNSQWKGMIDDIRLWDHERSLPEIQQNMSCGLSGTEAGLVGYWNCDEGLPGGNNQGINHLEDQSSTNSHGNLVSFSQNGGSSNFLLSDALLESNCQMTGELIISTHLDADCNGERDGGDTYLPGITYDILNADGTLYQTLTGNNQGMVILTDLPFGTYQIVAVLQNGYTFSNPVDGELLAILSTENTYIQSEFLFCNSSDNAANEDGLVINAFRDLDCDGVFDPGEPPYEGLRFRINPEPCPFGQDNLTVITDQDGQIVLENLPPGDYLIYPRFFPQGVYVTTPLNSYGAANIDFDNSLFEINFGICETGLCDVADNTLLLNTGLDENGDLYPEPPFVSTQIDPFWRLINEPPSFDGDDMATGYTVPNLFVIEPRPGAPGWNIIEGTWPLNVLGNSNFGFDNQDPQQPWLFQRQFCLSQDDTVCIDGNIRSDNFGELYLIGPDGNLIMVGNTTEGYLARTGPDGPICEVDSNTGRNFIRDWPIRAANRLFLEAGTYNLQFELANISAVAMGFAAEISITPFSESTTITNPDAFCGTGSLSIQKNIDTNCDSILNEGEPPGIGIEFLIESDQLDQPITAITNEFGEISLSGLSYGIYTITEVFRPGWVVTSPPGGSITVDISFEDPVAFVNFLNCERTCPELILQLDSCACCPVFDLVTVEDAAFNTVSLFINDTETIDMSSVVLADGFELSPASSGSELIIQRSDGIAIETSIERLIAYCYEDEGDESQSLEISFQDGNGVDLDCTSELQTNCTASDPCLPQLPCGFSMTYICGECSCGGDVATVTIRDAFGAPVDEDIVTITWYVDDVLTIPGAGNQNYLIPSYNGPLVVTAEVEYTQSDSTVCDTTISREILCLGDCPTVNFATCEDAAFSETQQCVDE